MGRFLEVPYRMPFAEYYSVFDKGFYVDFDRQLKVMSEWLLENGCRRTLDVGAITGGCIEHISSLGMRMDGVQFTADLKRLAVERLRRSGVESRIYVSPIDSDLEVPGGAKYDGVVTLGWFNLPFTKGYVDRYLRRVRDLLTDGGIFLFDFFEFDYAVVPPTEAVKLNEDLQYVSYCERLGSTIRRYYMWIEGHEKVTVEVGDLVDRDFGWVREALQRAGMVLSRSLFMELNYPRYFCAAKKA